MKVQPCAAKKGLSSVVTKSFREANVLLGGVPAKKRAENVEWKK